MASMKNGKEINSLSDFKWNYRVILINQLHSDIDFQNVLNTMSSEISERHIAWFLLTEGDVISNLNVRLSNDIQLQMQNTTASSNVVLIGKDGGIKMKLDELDLPAIFREIDSMPMRQAEMNNQLL
ncbi:hypothetical protein VIN01S_34960 [Vibrio inusitatus NBRC 102082]|uniref:DUF4174 domain-containing protein n=2 Tax=Vibrio inusitatus TaxID=413402 RepID=A0A4Y3I1G8_9VIBR|nr:hypothetical protein VIN01S_34960 [Vibrio inusitatus NBRC 102082]